MGTYERFSEIKNERDGSLRILENTYMAVLKLLRVVSRHEVQVDVACNKDNALLPDWTGR